MYRLIKDDSGHWYVIEVAQEELFHAWVAYMAGDRQTYSGPDFDNKRVAGPHAVTFDNVEIRRYGGDIPIRDDRRTWEDTADDEWQMPAGSYPVGSTMPNGVKVTAKR